MAGQRCPRCAEYDLKKEGPGDYALSKTPGNVQICTTCAVEESIEHVFNGHITPKEEWPLYYPTYHD